MMTKGSSLLHIPHVYQSLSYKLVSSYTGSSIKTGQKALPARQFMCGKYSKNQFICENGTQQP